MPNFSAKKGYSPKTELKKGDKVRVIKADERDAKFFNIGAIGTIEDFVPFPLVKFTEGDFNAKLDSIWAVDLDKLELVEDNE